MTSSPLTAATPLLLLGAGKMGGALLAGWLEQGLPAAGIVAVDPNPSPEMRDFLERQGVRHETEIPLDFAPAVAVVAVKPQSMGAALPRLVAALTPETIVVSIAAGTTIATFEQALGARPVVRAMPNTPAQVGRGVTVLVANDRADAKARAIATALLEAVGIAEWVEDEVLIDAVTAVSGGGPAYVFLLVETLAAAAIKAGLPAELAVRIARGTVAGSGELLARASEEAAVLRRNVTSPGGTTAAALGVLMGPDGNGGLFPLMEQAIAAATARSRELSKG